MTHYLNILQVYSNRYKAKENPIVERESVTEGDVRAGQGKAKNNKAPRNLRMELLKYRRKKVVTYIRKIF